jgi:hypothetical protein
MTRRRQAIPSAIAALSLSSACGGRELPADADAGTGESGSADTDEPLGPSVCEGPDAPSEPLVLVEGDMQPANFVRVGERIYWADEEPSTTLYRVDAATNNPWIAVTEDQPGINRIVSDAEFVYWTVEGLSQPGGQLLRASLDDEIELLDSGLHESAIPLTIDHTDDWIYYAEGGDSNPFEGGKLLRIRPDGSSKQVLAENLDGIIHDIEVDETHVWWVSSVSGSVGRVAKDGGDLELITDWDEMPFQIEVEDGIGWTIGLLGLYRVEPGEPPYFVNGHSGPYEIAADSTHVYMASWNLFEDTHLGWIHRYPLRLDEELGPLDGEFVTSKASPKPTSVQVDEHAIYWSTADEDSGEGGIWMLCKSAL